MSDRSDSSDDDNLSRKRHLFASDNDTPSKRAKPSVLGSFLAPFNSFFGMFRGENKAKTPTERVVEVSDDEDEEVVVVTTSPKKIDSPGPITFLNADRQRSVAGADENGKSDEQRAEKAKEEGNEEDVVVEKYIQLNVDVSDDSDENEIQEIQPSVSTPKVSSNRPVIKTSEVQEDDDLAVEFVKLVQTPNRDLQNAKLFQNEIIYLNENQDDDAASSVQFDTTEAAVFASPTPDESVSRPRTPNNWNLSSPLSSSMGSRNVRDYWRRSSAKKQINKRSTIRQPDAVTIIKKFATSQIQKTSRLAARGIQESSLSKYFRGLKQLGYINSDTNFELGRDKKKAKKPSASDLISKAKMAVAEIHASRSNTPSILSRESSVVSIRTPAGAQTPSSSSEFGSAKSENLSQMLSKLQNIQLNPFEKATQDRYKSVYETNKRKAENLEEELRIRGGHREQTKEERFDSVRKDLENRGISLRPKPSKKREEFMALPDSADLLVEKAWNRSLKQDELFLEAFSIQICRKDLATLSGLNWLNDNVINYYLQLICQRSADNSKYPKVYAFNTFFYTNVVSKGYASVKRWTRKVDIFAYDILLIPVHLGMHWCMAVVDFGKKRVEFYDSLYNGNTEVLPALKGYLAAESMDKKKVAFNFGLWTMEQMEDIPRQKNGSDCGVFSCQFGEWASRRKAPEFSQKHMPYYRKRMVHEIVAKQLMATI